MTNLENVIAQLQSQKANLEKEINRIDLALSALGGLNGHGDRGRRGGRRTLSPAARKRIAMAQKKRWAEWKAAQK